MAYYKKRRGYRKRRGGLLSKNGRLRKLVGQEPKTRIEKIARYGGAIGEIASTVAGIASLVNSEQHYFDTTINTSNITNTGSLQAQLTAVAQGDSQNNRSGNWILCKDFQMRLNVQVPTAQTSPVQVGWALVMDKKPSIALTTPWTDVFAAADANALINRLESERFVIIKRGTLSFTPGGNSMKQIKVYADLKMIHMKYDGTSGTNRDSNSIFLIMISNVASNQPTVNGFSRLNFHDN